MKTYIVGGAVRDMIMGIDPKDIDYVVTGSSPEEMISLGYTQVGADFPVFLCPKGEEYALARREVKTGEGYLGFESDFGYDVTLEDGETIYTINRDLLQKFIDLGFDPHEEYDVGELIKVFRNINQ